MDIQVILYMDSTEYNITETISEDIYNNDEDTHYELGIIFTFENNMSIKLQQFNPIRSEWIKLYNSENIEMHDDKSISFISSIDGIVKIEQLNETWDGSNITITIPLDSLKPAIKNFITIINKIF